MFTETNRRSWGIVVVVVAAIVFVCIIVGALILAGTFSSNQITGGAATTTAAAPAGAVEISFYSSNTKEDWINAVTESFNAAQIKVKSGEPIFVRVTHVTSGGSQSDILSGKIKPIAWSPGDQSWVDMRMRPRFVREIRGPRGVQAIAPEPAGQVISPRTAQTLRGM